MMAPRLRELNERVWAIARAESGRPPAGAGQVLLVGKPCDAELLLPSTLTLAAPNMAMRPATLALLACSATAWHAPVPRLSAVAPVAPSLRRPLRARSCAEPPPPVEAPPPTTPSESSKEAVLSEMTPMDYLTFLGYIGLPTGTARSHN